MKQGTIWYEKVAQGAASYQHYELLRCCACRSYTARRYANARCTVQHVNGAQGSARGTVRTGRQAPKNDLSPPARGRAGQKEAAARPSETCIAAPHLPSVLTKSVDDGLRSHMAMGV
eukprot:6192107-Pleurochrysis_carterae.AAC.6